MMPTRQGSFRLFRFAGIQVFVHWSWFLVAAYELQVRGGSYRVDGKPSLLWNVIEYVAIFGIVLLHEFGHALACRSVGGKAEQIVLWPLGGVAYVSPPQRPGANLWSIAAGPLVNVILFPILMMLDSFGGQLHWAKSMPNLFALITALNWINALMLGFNLLPIFPLDGGQILRSLLWFAIGRARSLMVTTIIGFIGAGLLLLAAVGSLLLPGGGSIWLVILAVFMLLNCWGGLVHARALARAESAPRHEGSACPACKAAPPQGSFWTCGQCRKSFDTFDTNATCPFCGTQYDVIRCLECGAMHPIQQWITQPRIWQEAPPIIVQPPPLPPRQW